MVSETGEAGWREIILRQEARMRGPEHREKGSGELFEGKWQRKPFFSARAKKKESEKQQMAINIDKINN